MRLTKSAAVLFFRLAVISLSFFSLTSFAGKGDITNFALKEPNSATKKTSLSQPAQDKVYLERYAEAQKLLETREFDQAIKKYKSLARKYKSYPAPQNDLGVIYRLQEKYKLAMQQFNKVIKRFPEYAPAYENLADTLTHLASAAYLAAAQHAKDSKVLKKKAALTAAVHELAKQSVEEDTYQDRSRRNAIPVSQQVVNTMHSWVNAWNNRDLTTYLSHYSSEFTPDRGKSVKQWAKRHKDNFTGSDYIRVYLDSIKMRQLDESTVAISFRELYESNLYEASASKEIVMEKVRSSWLIKSENQI